MMLLVYPDLTAAVFGSSLYFPIKPTPCIGKPDIQGY